MKGVEYYIARVVFGYCLVLAGIWHPYVVNVNAKDAAAISAILAFAGGLVMLIFEEW